MAKNDKPKKNRGSKEIKDGEVPRTLEKQNLGHNAKKEGFTGQHTYR